MSASSFVDGIAGFACAPASSIAGPTEEAKGKGRHSFAYLEGHAFLAAAQVTYGWGGAGCWIPRVGERSGEEEEGEDGNAGHRGADAVACAGLRPEVVRRAREGLALLRVVSRVRPGLCPFPRTDGIRTQDGRRYIGYI